ncbi:nucleolar protein 10 [Daktulosphaira vitifoliae]|uniref:nucleolar protein 10 n=1 Tax=Daktulosphaira vitifoliae TaxID=58002 RepID=UPI0021AA0FE4|nr:nucleolar protein 10 [Daktulosphaira vitifoliae]
MDYPLIYNLSCGKALPEWLSERKRRTLLKKNPEMKRHISLIQDFDMPGLSNTVKVTQDGQYILATGIYKPRIKCFDVNNLAMKFERCFDSEAVTFEILSTDYSKFVILQCDRYVEFHSQEGRYYRLRIPKFGRDMKYHYPTCDLYIGGSSPEIYRLNLDRGQFLNPFLSNAGDEINKLAINPVHNMLITGTKEGKIEAWDSRAHTSIGVLDCALNSVTNDTNIVTDGFPSITALQFENALNLGVGTATGQILLYDLRSNKPYRVKDHLFGLPIRDIVFHEENILSMDSSSVKIWNKNTGKLFSAIESGNDTQFNNLCVVPNTGMLFIANENSKIQTHYIPSLGPAPKWCGFLDALVEELEETKKETIYDDYKFVTRNELEELGLAHLIGTNLLKAFMHGYFVDIRLYRKAKSVAEPFAFEEYRRKKIREKIESERTSRVQVQKLPPVNKELALKLIHDEKEGKKNKNSSSLLKDDRFKALFENPAFQVDTNAEEYKLLNPVLKRLDKSKQKKLEQEIQNQFQQVDDEIEGKPSSEESSDEYSSDEDQRWTKELKAEYRAAKRRRIAIEKEDHKISKNLENIYCHEGSDENNQILSQESLTKNPKFYEIREGEEFNGPNSNNQLAVSLNTNATLGERIHLENFNSVKVLTSGNRQITFSTQKEKKYEKSESEAEKHKQDRLSIIRKGPKNLRKPRFYSGPKSNTFRKKR